MPPPIVSRSEWGATARPGGDPLPIDRVGRLFVHYTGTASDFQADHRNCALRVLGIYRFHTSPSPADPTKPWADIAYTDVICIHGVIFEGRGIGKRTAATGPCNDDSYALCLLGNDREGRRDITPEALAAFAWRIAWYEERKGGRLDVGGHRDCMGTACPGDELYALVRSGAIRNTKEDDLPDPKDIWTFTIPGGGGSDPERAQVHLRYQTNALRALLALAKKDADDDVDEQAIAQAVLDGLSPETIAAAVAEALPPDLARQVVDELTARLQT